MGEKSVVISLTGVKAIGFHGVLDSERREGQLFIVDLVLEIPQPTGDELCNTADYSVIAQMIVDQITSHPVDLIETLAARIADAVLAEIECGRVSVTVHKPNAPIPVEFDDVSVTITRSHDA